jgi:hypothetical protein
VSFVPTTTEPSDASAHQPRARAPRRTRLVVVVVVVVVAAAAAVVVVVAL